LYGGSQRSAILVHGGGTRTLDNRVQAIAELLRVNGHFVYTDLEDDPMCFDYQDSTWQKLGVVICRPGVGTATECVKWRIPMIVLRDQENFEAECIAEKLRQLGLAHFLNDKEEFSTIAQVCEIISPENKHKYFDPFENCKITGIGDSASFLAEHWNLIRRSK
jgi:UDP-N-acetylglucosamine:LPS N-acetylglucosamine transferase